MFVSRRTNVLPSPPSQYPKPTVIVTQPVTFVTVNSWPGPAANDNPGGSVPAPNPPGSGGTRWPAPKMFASPRTDKLTVDALEAESAAATSPPTSARRRGNAPSVARTATGGACMGSGRCGAADISSCPRSTWSGASTTSAEAVALGERERTTIAASTNAATTPAARDSLASLGSMGPPTSLRHPETLTGGPARGLELATFPVPGGGRSRDRKSVV